MRKRRWWLAIGTVVVAGAATAAALALSFRGSGGPEQVSRQLNHHDFARLWQETRVGESTAAVLARWPKDPYQHYTDNLKDNCFEWSDESRYLYNLCFKNGVLRSKDLV
jgi:hypothetical protein